MNIELYSEYNEKHLNDIYQIYNSVGWANHNKNNINEIFNNSTFVTLASYNDKIIGFARALSDGVFNAAIYDLVVKKEFQSQYIGIQILNHILTQIGSLSCVHLGSTTNNVKFYEKAGFRKLKTGMAIYQSEALKMEYTEKT